MGEKETYRRLWRVALLILAAHTVLFVIQIPQVYLYNTQNPHSGTLGVALARLAWGVYLWGVMTGFMLWLGVRLPLARGRLRRNLLLHALLGAGFGVVQHYGYYAGMRALGLTTAESFRSGVANATVLFNFISTSMVRYAAVIAIQQAYLHFRESQERAYRLQQAELEALKMQLHPHFFFNTLNALSALIYSSPKDADRMITQLGDLFRFALRKDKAQEVTLAEELNFLEAFLQIHQTLMGDRLRLEWRVGPEALSGLVPNLILQPLVENAIRHGVAPLEQGGSVEVGAERRGDRLLLSVRDSGQGPGPGADVGGGGGVGLENTRARLLSLYGAGHRFAFEHAPGEGSVVTIELPFREGEAGGR